MHPPDSGLTRRDILRQGAGAGLTLTSAGALLAACGSSQPAAKATPRRGGNLRVGLAAGSIVDTIDPAKQNLPPDAARCFNLYDPLVFLGPANSVENVLAEEFVPSSASADEWTIRVKPGIEFHNGKSLGADDVIFTLKRILDPKTGSTQTPLLSKVLDPQGMTKLDARTARVKLISPCAILRDILATVNLQPLITPAGFDPKHPVGTGAFKYESFTPGVSSVFTANENYWGGRPHVDQLTLTDLTDETARINALLGGQVDAIASVPFPSIASVKGAGNLTLLEIPSDGWYPILMNCASKPFSDVRARQAFRLLANRPQLVEQAYLGHGQLGNDLYALYDPDYNHSLPQRHQDIGQAKSLLKQAGLESYAFTFTAANLGPGSIQSSVAFGQQANAAGVKVKVQQVPVSEYLGPNNLHWPLADDQWLGDPYLTQANVADGPNACFPDTHFGASDPQYAKLYYEAFRTVNPALRKEIVLEMQRIQYERGGYIVWGFLNTVDAASNKAKGWVLDRTGRSFGSWKFKDVYFV
ncbi:MAG TPA: ABC transporter substrate-binding protein [Solirubrobacteraceae bacterium]|nr:ABC transporter substrate-binding protein [Solirubrobacteraceae bacterium]